MPCSRTISLKNKLATLKASSVLWQTIKWAIFENRSTTTKIESLPFLVLDNPTIKFMLRSVHGELGIGKGVYKPCGLTLDLALRHSKHFLTKLSTSLSMCGQ